MYCSSICSSIFLFFLLRYFLFCFIPSLFPFISFLFPFSCFTPFSSSLRSPTFVLLCPSLFSSVSVLVSFGSLRDPPEHHRQLSFPRIPPKGRRAGPQQAASAAHISFPSVSLCPSELSGISLITTSSYHTPRILPEGGARASGLRSPCQLARERSRPDSFAHSRLRSRLQATVPHGTIPAFLRETFTLFNRVQVGKCAFPES